MHKTLKEISELIDGELSGDGDIIITGVSGIKEAGSGDITFIAHPKYFSLLKTTQASAVIAPLGIKKPSTKPLILTANPSLAFAKIVSWTHPPDLSRPQGIHPTSIIGKDVSLGKNVAIGPYVVIEDNVCIADQTIIYSGCFLGQGSKIGAACLIYPHVCIRERTVIGERVIIHSGTVIGSDGFGFVTIEGRHQKIPQLGSVEIQDDVEIGANVSIDRARFDKTIIGKGTKIDNLVHIAHNVIIGANSLIIAQVGISGSTIIGKDVTLAGQAGLAGHITVGDGAVVAAQAGVTKSVPPNTTVSGYPAKPHRLAKRINAYVQNLGKLYARVKILEEKINKLQSKTKTRKKR